MTLHWWMHWFWVTMLLTLLACSGRTLAAPQTEKPQDITIGDVEPKHADRQSRAMYFSKTAATTAKPPVANTSTTDNQTDAEPTINVTLINATTAHPSIQWTKVNVNSTDVNITVTEAAIPKNETDNGTVTDTAKTETQNMTLAPKKKNSSRTDFVKGDLSLEGVSESRIVTEKPLSLETTYLQTRVPPNLEMYRRVVDSEGGMDTGAIAGISFAALVLTALAGSTAFVLYRRRYLNKPQTLNDKCSNPDSSGYLDDSTIRDNSEEMYSLDNDSFLNSLEAMTIQNYWTDTVKHTKL